MNVSEWIAHVVKELKGEITMPATAAESPDGGLVRNNPELDTVE